MANTITTERMSLCLFLQACHTYHTKLPLLFVWAEDYNKLAICMISTHFSDDIALTHTQQDYKEGLALAALEQFLKVIP